MLSTPTDYHPAYILTPEEIRAACLEIQAGWSRSEEQARASGLIETNAKRDRYWRQRRFADSYTVPVVRMALKGGAS